MLSVCSSQARAFGYWLARKISMVLPLLLIAACSSSMGVHSVVMPQADWITVDASGHFTMKVPPATSYKPIQGIDSRGGRFINRNFEIEFIYGWYNPSIDDIRTSYRSTSFLLDGKESTLYYAKGKEIEGFSDCRTNFVGLVTGALEPPSTVQDTRPDGTVIDLEIAERTTLHIFSCVRRERDVELIESILRTIHFPVPE